MTIADTPSAIKVYQLLTYRAGLKLEILGMRRRGRQVSTILRESFGFRGSREELLQQLNARIAQEREKLTNEATAPSGEG